jgi:hypothetical protein
MPICGAVVSKSWAHDIGLEPDQVDLERSGKAEAPVVFLAADDKTRIVLPDVHSHFISSPTPAVGSLGRRWSSIRYEIVRSASVLSNKT